MPAKKIKPDFRINPKKFQYLMARSRYSNPPGKHRRTFVFTPAELGLEDRNHWSRRRHYTTMVDNFINVNNLKGKELKEAKENHYRLIREKVRNELRESMQHTVVVPEAYDPEGLTTVNLESSAPEGAE